MSENSPYVGIDFGTTFSSMAWYNPRIGQAEVILNSEGEAKTPSLVYFGGHETLVGKPVDELLEDASDNQAQRDEVFQRTVTSIKRDLIHPPKIAIPGGRFVRPVEVAAEIIKKLKRDAEDGVFHKEVRKAVITCPAEFNVLQRQVIERAGRLAGFEEVVLLEEPVAGALAYSRSGLEVGRHVLVYDLGGGTFDLAVLDSEGESFHVALEPKGMDKCGGEDFDLALYYHCDGLAREQLGRPINLTGGIDLKFLRRCRQRKENLSARERVTVSALLPSAEGPDTFRHELDQDTFHELISDYVETTVRLTETIVEEAEEEGHRVDTVVLIGGSSKVLLVKRMLNESLPVNPLNFDKRDVAVALGAAHYAHIRWVPPPTPPPRPKPEPPDQPEPSLERYREAVKMARSRGELNRAEVDRLDTFASQLGLSREQAARVEREEWDETKEDALLRRYREAVEMVWSDGELDGLEAAWLRARARELSMSRDEAARVEREVMDAPKEEVFVPAPKPEVPEQAGDFVLDATLAGHTDEVNSVAFSPDGRFLASGGSDHAVGGWNLRTGESVGTLSGAVGRVNCVAFSPDGRFLAGAGFDKLVRVWKLPKAEPLHAPDHSDWVWSVVFDPGGRFLVSGGADATVRLWSPETGEMLRALDGHTHWVLSVAASPKGGFLLSGGADGTVRVWDPKTERQLFRLDHPGRVWSVAASPDGSLAVSGGENGELRTWDLKTGKMLHAVAAHPGKVSSVAMSPDGRLLFSGGADGRVKVWSPRTGELLNVLVGHTAEVRSVAVSPDGNVLATGSADKTIKLWRRQAAPDPAGGSSRPDTLPDETPRPAPGRPQDLPD